LGSGTSLLSIVGVAGAVYGHQRLGITFFDGFDAVDQLLLDVLNGSFGSSDSSPLTPGGSHCKDAGTRAFGR
jgi:hypothetical protein